MGKDPEIVLFIFSTESLFKFSLQNPKQIIMEQFFCVFFLIIQVQVEESRKIDHVQWMKNAKKKD